MSRITGKEANGRYYIVEDIISLVGGGEVNPIKTWITGNENRGYGKPIDKLGQLEEFGDRIGCPLEVLTEIAEKGFYCDYGYIPPYRIHRIDIFRKELGYYDEETDYHTEKLCNYKKTFWLKKDESE